MLLVSVPTVVDPPRTIVIDGRKVAQARSRLLMSQEALAIASGMSLNTVKHLEPNPQKSVFIGTARRLAEALKLTQEQFIQDMAVSPPASSMEICFQPAASHHDQIVKLAAAENLTPAELVAQFVTDALKRRRIVNGVPVSSKVAASRSKPRPH